MTQCPAAISHLIDSRGMTEDEHRAMLKQYGYAILCADESVADCDVDVRAEDVEARRQELAMRHPDKVWITYAPVGITQAHSRMVTA